MARTLTELQRLQKRARDKDSRLRSKGAMESEIKTTSPLRPWSEVKSLPAVEQVAYKLRLKNYTSRKTAFTVYESGEILPAGVERDTKRAIAQFNVKAAKERARINKIGGTQAEKIESRMWKMGMVNFKTGELNAGRGSSLGALTEIAGEYQRPRTKRWAKKRLKALQAMVARPYYVERARQRSSMVTMLRKIGASDLADRVKKLSNDQFDVLSARTDIWEHLGFIYIPEGDRAAAPEDIVISDSDLYAQLDILQDLVSGVQAINVRNYHKGGKTRRPKR